MTLAPEVRAAAELVVGNLNENGYLTATDEELVDGLMSFGAQGPELIRFRLSGGAKAQPSHLRSGGSSGRDCIAAKRSDESIEIAAAATEATERMSGTGRRCWP